MLHNILFLIFLLLLSAFFSGTEVALLTVSKIRARTFLKQKKRGSKSLCKLKNNTEKMIITILIGNNVVNVAAAAIATVIATDYFGSSGIGIATGVMAFLLLVFGEITPKTFASRHADRISLLVAKPILYLSYILYPLIIFFNGITHGIMRLLKVDKKSSPLTEEELKTMIEVSAEKEIIDTREKELLEGVLEFNDISAGDVMTPKNKMFSIDSKLSVKKSLRVINKSHFSRIPVFSGSRNNISGFVHIREILNALEKRQGDKKLGEISENPVFVPSGMKLNKIFREFQIYQTHMAIVVNDNNETVGLVTLEDLMEELVGEIMDEKDLSPATIIRIDKYTIVVHGKTEIERINKFFNTELPSKSYRTIDEFIKNNVKKLIRDAKIEMDDIIIRIRDMERNEITKVSITKKKKFFQKLDEYLKKPTC